MKLPCKVIEDLLPLYHDGVCSGESRSLVDEHIEECEKCKSVLDALDAEPEVSHIDDAAPLKSIQKKWNTARAKSYRKGIVITCVVFLCLGFLFYGLTDYRVVPVPADLLEITEVSQLNSGVAFHFSINDNKDLYKIESTLTKEGVLYWTPMRAVWEAPRKFDTGLYNMDMWVDIEGMEVMQQAEINSFYIGPVGEGILVWEKGMELPPPAKGLRTPLSAPLPTALPL